MSLLCLKEEQRELLLLVASLKWKIFKSCLLKQGLGDVHLMNSPQWFAYSAAAGM